MNLPALRSAWFDVARNAGLPTRAHGFRLYDLRRSFGTLLIQQGTPTALVAQALGHADEHTTRKHYAFLRLDQSRSAVELAGQAMTQHRPESPS